MLSVAERCIRDAYESAAGESCPSELNDTILAASDTALRVEPEWRKEAGTWCLYFNGLKFGDK